MISDMIGRAIAKILGISCLGCLILDGIWTHNWLSVGFWAVAIIAVVTLLYRYDGLTTDWEQGVYGLTLMLSGLVIMLAGEYGIYFAKVGGALIGFGFWNFFGSLMGEYVNKRPARGDR